MSSNKDDTIQMKSEEKSPDSIKEEARRGPTRISRGYGLDPDTEFIPCRIHTTQDKINWSCGQCIIVNHPYEGGSTKTNSFLTNVEMFIQCCQIIYTNASMFRTYITDNVARGFDVNTIYQGFSLLDHVLSKCDNETKADFVNILLTHGMNPNLRTDGKPALTVANAQCVDLLLRYKADITKLTKYYPGYWLTARQKNDEEIRYLETVIKDSHHWHESEKIFYQNELVERKQIEELLAREESLQNAV